MCIANLYSKATVFVLTAALLSACGGYGVDRVQTTSWMAAESSGSDLLYVSEFGQSEIQVFSYPQDKLVGTLTGVYYPEGECTDAAGDVFVANTASDYVSEFPHGGTKPIARYVDANHHPFACSVDPTSGNLAVTEYGVYNSVPDTIAVFSSPSSPPTQYVYPLFIDIYCAYDPQGDLFVDGYDLKRKFSFVELAKGKAKFVRIVLDKEFTTAGNVQWDGSHITVSNAKNVIYRFAITGTRGQTVGATTVVGVRHGLRLFSFQAATLIVPNVIHEGSLFGKGTLEFYDYPQGGLPLKKIPKIEGPDDAVVSLYSGSGVRR